MKNLTNLPQSVISRVKLLYRYGYRLEQKENMTDPLKKIELFKVGCYFRELLTSHPFKAIASPAYIVASLENLNEVSADFFCPVKKCFEFACEANFRKSTIPEYKKEYQEIENRYKDAVIASLGPGPDWSISGVRTTPSPCWSSARTSGRWKFSYKLNTPATRMPITSSLYLVRFVNLFIEYIDGSTYWIL